MARRTANVRSDSGAKVKSAGRSDCGAKAKSIGPSDPGLAASPAERRDSGFVAKPLALTDSSRPEASTTRTMEPQPAGVVPAGGARPAELPSIVRAVDTMVGNVALLKAAVAPSSSPSGSPSSRTRVIGSILVRDLGFQKIVGIHYSDDDGGTWRDAHAQWVRDAGGGLQEWTFEISRDATAGATRGFRFACFYQDVASNSWYWDNNSGEDYLLSVAS